MRPQHGIHLPQRQGRSGLGRLVAHRGAVDVGVGGGGEGVPGIAEPGGGGPGRQESKAADALVQWHLRGRQIGVDVGGGDVIGVRVGIVSDEIANVPQGDGRGGGRKGRRRVRIQDARRLGEVGVEVIPGQGRVDAPAGFRRREPGVELHQERVGLGRRSEGRSRRVLLLLLPAHRSALLTPPCDLLVRIPGPVHRPRYEPQPVGHPKVELLLVTRRVVQGPVPLVPVQLQFQLGDLVALRRRLGPNTPPGGVGIDSPGRSRRSRTGAPRGGAGRRHALRHGAVAE
mmetsp:Transcript_26754/g.54744  ORF Transcript_26754/g.54744 Transcript_26754/m.54744 type:complete len:286 (+) Transcript_26754:700-1557(+)